MKSDHAEGKSGARTPSRGAVRGAAREIAYLALGVALITVCAWVTVPVFTIPFTLQTFAVAFVGALFGWKKGAGAVIVYLLMGLVGVPVFAGFKSGVVALAGPTGGYIIGFVFLALIPALFKQIPVKSKKGRFALTYAAMLIGLAVLYAIGTAWFLLVYNGGSADPMGVAAALSLCVLPYLLPDFMKLAVAAALSVRLERFLR